MSTLAYRLGRTSAPLFLKVNWVLKSLAGSEAEQIAAERQMGRLLAATYEEDHHAFSNNRLDEVAARLTSRLANPLRRHQFKLDHSGVLNACALPGGFVYLSETLLDAQEEDLDAIAFVLAHEIAHGIHGDASKRFLTRAVVHTTLNTRKVATGAVARLLAHLIHQGYSREQEFRADRFAVALTRAAGFDPMGGCRLFERLDALADPPATLPVYLSSHPPTADRVRRIAARAAKLDKNRRPAK